MNIETGIWRIKERISIKEKRGTKRGRMEWENNLPIAGGLICKAVDSFR